MTRPSSYAQISIQQHHPTNCMLAYILQGGYSDLYVPFCGLAVIEEMSGIKTDAVDVLLEDVNDWGYQELQPHQSQVISKVEELVDRLKGKLTNGA